MITLYHYTDIDGYLGIKRSKKIKIATRHAFHGDGVYFNSRRVNHTTVTKEDIADDNYQGGGYANLRDGYVDYVVAVEFPESEVRCANRSRHLWVYPTSDYLDLNEYKHKFYDVDEDL